MSSRTSPALHPDPKRPRLLVHETTSTPAVPSSAPNGLARANYIGRAAAPTQAVPTYERASYPATQKVTATSAQALSVSRLHAAPTAETSYPSSSPSNSVHARPRRSGHPFTAAEGKEIVMRLQKDRADIVIAAILERTPQEIQSRIRDLVWQLEGDLANGPQKRPPYTPEDYRRLLEMHRRGESVERIALVLNRTTSSVINHFRKHKPIWFTAGDRVEPALLLRDSKIDYEERIQRELAGPAEDLAARIAKIRLAAATQPAAAAPSTPSGSPSTSGSSLQAGSATSAETLGTITVKPSFPPFKFGNDAPAPPGLSAIAPTSATAAAAALPKVNLFTKLRPSTSTSVADSPANLPAAAREVATSAAAAAPPSTGFSAYSTAASLVPIASNTSFSPAPSLVTKPVPTSAPLPTAVAPAPPPSKPVLQDAKPATDSAPLPPPPPSPTTTPTADTLDPDASPLSPMSDDDSPPSLSPRLPNPVPHHAPHLPLLPLWCDGHYDQGMSGLKRFLQLVEESRKSRTRSTSSS